MAGILTSLLTFPLAPARVAVAVARVVQSQVDQELHRSLSPRAQLVQLDDAARSGALSEAEHEDAQRAILDRLAQPPELNP